MTRSISGVRSRRREGEAVCHRFTMLTHDETQDVVRALSYGAALVWEPDWPACAPRVDAFPGSCVGVIVPTVSGGVEVVEATWGFTAPWAKHPVFNTRIETALSPDGSIWSAAVAQGRCIVPAVRFFETQNRLVAVSDPASSDNGAAFVSDAVSPKRRRRLYSFGMPDGEPVLLAGVQQDGRFSVVTTEPNESVAPIHDRMPLVLAWHEAWRWLGPDFASLANRSGSPLDVRAEGESCRRTPGIPDNQMRLF